jgi:hypothetical protein
MALLNARYGIYSRESTHVKWTKVFTLGPALTDWKHGSKSIVFRHTGTALNETFPEALLKVENLAEA